MIKRKLIEVSLPLEAINAAAGREKSIRHGHPSTLHLYWARRPLATTRAVLFAQLVDDPSSKPEKFPSIEQQDAERARLHKLIEDLVLWENSNNEELLEQARTEIRESNNGVLPPLLDPFAGGGAIPLEAQRLGLEAHASDLNPLAVLINKGLIEIPPKFAGRKPVFPGAAENQSEWILGHGLAEDIRRYGEWMRDEAERRIGHHYPKVTAPGGTEHTVIAWIWARTVKSPNPANPIETPLVRSWWLSKKKGKEAYIVPVFSNGKISFTVKHDQDGPTDGEDGTIGRGGGYVVGDETPLSLKHVREEAKKSGLGTALLAVVADGPSGRLYISPSERQSKAAEVTPPESVAEGDLPSNPRDFKTPNYGMTKWSDLFSPRQLLAMATLSGLVQEARAEVLRDAEASGLELGEPLKDGGAGAVAYADAVATYLSLAVSRLADYSSNICTWHNTRETISHVFTRQALAMAWDFAEVNPFSSSSGNFFGQVGWVAKAVAHTPARAQAQATQAPAQSREYSGMAVSTDPPYYDNIGYSDLSDFFYVWLRPMLQAIHPELVGTMLSPKSEELVANPYRLGGKGAAEKFFVEGFNSVFEKIRATANLDVPMTVYYAYKQQEASADGTSSTGWHTLLDGLLSTGWEITATWPMRTELSNRTLAGGTNALASSIVLACRPRSGSAEAITRRGFLTALKSELPSALRALIQGSISPVDLAQAAIGPGMSVFSRYSRVREADGSDMSVKEALLLINATLDEVLNEQESDFDPQTRFAVKWYKQFGWGEGPSGTADQLARSSDTSIGALERGGVFQAKAGKAKLLSPSLLSGAWDPETDESLSVWECVVRLAAIMSGEGAESVAKLLPGVENRVGLDPVKELGFLLFHEAEKKSDTKDAILFNGLVGAWGDLRQQARKLEASQGRASQMTFNFDDEEA